jgi:response regulator of citrate/malate metabolism
VSVSDLRVTADTTAEAVDHAYADALAEGLSADAAYVVIKNALRAGLRDELISPAQWRTLQRRLEGL